MKALRTLNPLFWKYRNRLVAGFVFIIFTNGLAVFAPALVGEGVNVLREAYVNYLAPVANATDASEITDVFQNIRETRKDKVLHFPPPGITNVSSSLKSWSATADASEL